MSQRKAMAPKPATTPTIIARADSLNIPRLVLLSEVCVALFIWMKKRFLKREFRLNEYDVNKNDYWQAYGKSQVGIWFQGKKIACKMMKRCCDFLKIVAMSMCIAKSFWPIRIDWRMNLLWITNLQNENKFIE